MNVYAVLLKGYKDPEYYQCDGWTAKDGAVALVKGEDNVAVFPFENLIGIVNLTAKARLSEEAAREAIKEIHGK
jgi:hypothetical protein